MIALKVYLVVSLATSIATVFVGCRIARMRGRR